MDMEKSEGFSARVTLSEFVNPTGWGYANAGLLYIFKGSMMSNAEPQDVGDQITITAKIAAGRTAKVYLYDANYQGTAGQNLYKATITGTGNMQSYVLAASNFTTFGTNTLNMSQTKAIFLQYEIGASVVGEAFPGVLQEEMVWESLKCTGTACPKMESTPIKQHSYNATEIGTIELRNVKGQVLQVIPSVSELDVIRRGGVKPGIYSLKFIDQQGAQRSRMWIVN